MNTEISPPISPKSYLPFEFKLPKFPEPLFASPTSRELNYGKSASLSRNYTELRERVSSHPKGHVKLDFFTVYNRRAYQAFENSPNSLHSKQIYSQEESFDNTAVRIQYSVSPEPNRNTSKFPSPIKRGFLTPNRVQPLRQTHKELEGVQKENANIKEQLKKINEHLSKVLENSSNLYLVQHKQIRGFTYTSTQNIQKQLEIYE